MSLIKKIGKDSKKKKPKRVDWEFNQQLVSDEFWKQATVPGKLKMPKYSDIAKKTGLNVKSIERHVKCMNVKKHMQKLRCVEDKMLIIFMNKVSKSNNHNMWDSYFTLTNPSFATKKSTVDLTTGGKPILPNVIAPGD